MTDLPIHDRNDELRNWGDQEPPYEFARWEGEGRDRKPQTPAPGRALWGRNDGLVPPPIGARIWVSMNNLGPAIVVGYFTLHGWLGILADLEAAPDWHKRQNNNDPRGHLFGPEFEPLGRKPENVSARIDKLTAWKHAQILRLEDPELKRYERSGAESAIARADELIAAISPEPKLEAGAILYTSWGYDQTNVDFYRVEKIAGQWVTFRKISKVEASDDTADNPATLTGRVVPADPIEPIGEPKRRKILARESGAVAKLESYSYAYLWDGKPRRVSHYA